MCGKNARSSSQSRLTANAAVSGPVPSPHSGRRRFTLTAVPSVAALLLLLALLCVIGLTACSSSGSSIGPAAQPAFVQGGYAPPPPETPSPIGPAPAPER